MKPSLPLVALLAALSLPLPATAGTVVFDYQGCARPVTLTIDGASSVAVWRQLATQAGFAVRAGTGAPDIRVDFSMSGPLYEVLSALARYTGAVLVASDVDSCVGARQPRAVWLMSEGAATASTLMGIEDTTAEPAAVPAAPDVPAPAPRDANAGDAPTETISLTPPQRRGLMAPAERTEERERRRQAEQAQRGRRQ